MKLAEITSGGANIISSGSVFTFGENPVEIVLDDLKIILEFKDEKDEKGNNKKEFRNEFLSPGNKILNIIFYNYTNSLGIGTVIPRLIGKYKKKKLYMNYIIHGDTTRHSKLIQYTFYASDENASEAEVSNA